ncbi:MAG TPA: hypothetical protein VF167_09670 [Longimicrobiaceae bacterium]
MELRVYLVLGTFLGVMACGSDGVSEGVDTTDPERGVVLEAELPTEVPEPEVPEPSAPVVQVASVTDLPPNELGKILVLEYHRLGEPENEYSRKAENFRADLELLYRSGYRPVTMRQVLEGMPDLPRGATPVIFTIDDSSRGQFYLLEDGSVDPNTMLGMWEEFRAAHPDWNSGAVWCILPGADYPSNFFGEKPSREVPRAEREAIIQKKVDYLIEHDHEICNHTLYHARLDRARDDAQVQEFIGRGEDSIQVYLPDDYDIVTFSLPLGVWPKNRSLAWQGEYKGKPYHYEFVLEVTGDANESPFDRTFDPHSVNRFIVAPGRLERQIAAWERDPSRRFVSDGDPTAITVPTGAAQRVDTVRWPDLTVVELPPEGEVNQAGRTS